METEDKVAIFEPISINLLAFAYILSGRRRILGLTRLCRGPKESPINDRLNVTSSEKRKKRTITKQIRSCHRREKSAFMSSYTANPR